MHMDTEEKLLAIYKALYGDAGMSCYLEIATEDDEQYGDPIGVRLMKDGNLCGYYSKHDLLFDYITKDWMVTE